MSSLLINFIDDADSSNSDRTSFEKTTSFLLLNYGRYVPRTDSIYGRTLIERKQRYFESQGESVILVEPDQEATLLDAIQTYVATCRIMGDPIDQEAINGFYRAN